MVSTEIRGVPLCIDSTSELATPDNERILQHAESFEILNQGGRSLVGLPRQLGDVGGEAAVMVPAAMEELDEAHSTLCQSAGERKEGFIRIICCQAAGLAPREW